METVTLLRGSGKTSDAARLASSLGLRVYRVDLAAVISKYIGETEKNLAELFRKAEQTDSLLFFDEADALFGQRSRVAPNLERLLAAARQRKVPVALGIEKFTIVTEASLRRLKRNARESHATS